MARTSDAGTRSGLRPRLLGGLNRADMRRFWVILGIGALVAVAPVPADSTQGSVADTDPAAPRAHESGELLFVTEGNRLRRIDVDSIDSALAGEGSLAEDVLVERASDGGRDVNGQICERPGVEGGFVAGEDSGQPNPPAGWGVFDADGTQVGKLTASYFVGGAEPHGCAFAPNGNLFTTEVGFQGFGTANGQLIMWFPPFDRFPGPPGAYPNTLDRSTNFCKLATDLGTAGSVQIDDEGNVFVSQSAGLKVEKFSPPFPTGPDAAGGCGNVDSTGAPVATTVHRTQIIAPSDGMLTFSGIAISPRGTLYVASVLTGRIAEYDFGGRLLRLILAPAEELPPIPTGHPQGLAVGDDGTIYYADLDLRGTLPNVGPGPNGKVRRIRFDANGDPLAPEIVKQGLAFPDGVAIFAGNLQPDRPLPLEWPTHAGGGRRQFFNPDETWLTAASAPNLIEKWRFETDAVVTASPSVATVLRNGEERRLVFAVSWDYHLYALDFDDGSLVWLFEWEDQPGASFPGAGSATVADVNGTRMVFFGAGEHVYALDAATGDEAWRFAAGTGCRDATTGEFPGLCSFAAERNQIESTPIVHDGVVYVGMDVNDVATGKGGFYAIDAVSGTLRWFWDPESGWVCRPNGADEHGPGDEIRRYDGYHSESELGLPDDFFATRAGCDHPRTRYGCGNIWSSPALDAARGHLYFGTSNCDTDNNPATPVPAPPMPPFDEALVALRLDGTSAWRWRPREVDNDDLAFGAVPNLFAIDVDGVPTDVVGIGGKDGTYYVIDRDGVNERTGVAWNGPAPRALPYWERNVVPGGAIGGIIATAAVDEGARRVLFSTAPGDDVLAPQRPTVHALDLDTGAIVWQNAGTQALADDASYAPTSAVPGVMIVGSVITPHLRFFDTATGELVADHVVPAQETFSGVASGAAVIDGTVVTGAGIGARSSGGSSPGDFAAYTPSAVVAFCVPGAPGCPMPEIIPLPAAVTEGDAATTVMRVPVALRAPGTQEVRVDYRTIDGRATAPADYQSVSGTLVIEPGTTGGFIDVTVHGDVLDEALEDTLFIEFSNPKNAIIGGFGPRVGVLIVDDDRRPRLDPQRVAATEGDSGTTTIEVPITLSAVSGRRVRVDFVTIADSASSTTDFVPASGTILIPAGRTRGVARITIRNDQVPEGAEHFFVSFRNPQNAVLGGILGLAVVDIVDTD